MANKRMLKAPEFVSLTAFCILASACAAYDLGNAGKKVFPPNNPDKPTWEDNINNVVAFKCATCHTPEDVWYKPKNTQTKLVPENPAFRLENIGKIEFFSLENSEMMKRVKLCIEKECGESGNVPMPPKYATQLSEIEKKALLNFIAPFIKDEPKNTKLSTSFGDNCAICHGNDGRSSQSYPKLGGPGANAISLQQFKDIIQNGRGGMRAIPGYDLSQAEQDHSVLYGAN